VITDYLASATARLCNLGFIEIQWFAWDDRLFQDLEDRVAAGRKTHLRWLNELTAKELNMLIDRSDESASGQAGDDEADVTDMVSVRMGGSEPESMGSDKDKESGDAKDELVDEDNSKPKVKGKGRAKTMAKEQINTTTGLLITMIWQGKAGSYQTAESVQVCRIPLARQLSCY
jgi:hypothetical protein